MYPHDRTDPALSDTPPTVEDRGGFPAYDSGDMEAVLYAEPITVETAQPDAWEIHLEDAAASIGGMMVGAPIVVANPTVFSAIWRAHLAKARGAGDASLAWTAGSLLEAVERGRIAAGRVDLRGEAWAIWVDQAGRLVGVAQPADTYLTGS